jgi:hypothetical protein
VASRSWCVCVCQRYCTQTHSPHTHTKSRVCVRHLSQRSHQSSTVRTDHLKCLGMTIQIQDSKNEARCDPDEWKESRVTQLSKTQEMRQRREPECTSQNANPNPSAFCFKSTTETPYSQQVTKSQRGWGCVRREAEKYNEPAANCRDIDSVVVVASSLSLSEHEK